MSLLTNPKDLIPNTIFKGLIYGQPGSGKTTLALSAPNAVCIDFDRGMNRVQPQFRLASLQVNTYKEVLALIESDEIAPFDTIVVDTLGKLIDRMCDYIASNNPKARQADGQMTMKGWGEVKTTFQAFFKLLATKNKSLLFVAHESEEKSGDDTIKRPDCSGSARKDIVKELDFMGYMEISGNKRVINFNPSDKFYAKNALDLPQGIEIPNPDKAGNTFIAKQIVDMMKNRAVDQAELNSQYDGLIMMIDANIEALKTAKEVNAYYDEMGKKAVIWDSAFYEKRKLADRLKLIGVDFDKETKRFVEKPGDNTPPFLKNKTIAA